LRSVKIAIVFFPNGRASPRPTNKRIQRARQEE
jgi:hypothetical protein